MLVFIYIFILSISLVLFLTLVNFLISDYPFYRFSREEVSSYECGFEQNSLSRLPLSIRYFLLTLVFLIFDLEVMLLLISPLDFVFSLSFSFFVVCSVIFVSVLILGLLFEWYDGALEWVL